MVTANPFRLMVAVNSCRNLATAELYVRAVGGELIRWRFAAGERSGSDSCCLVEPTCTQLTTASSGRNIETARGAVAVRSWGAVPVM